MYTRFKIAALCAATTLCLSTSAFAHVAFVTGEAPAEGYYTGELRIPHGCDGKATTGISVKIPEGFILARPMVKPGWKIEIIKGDYSKSYDNHGKTVTSGPVEIRWTGGEIPDDFFDSVQISGKISGVEAGTALPFVTTQTCGADTTVVWGELAAEGQNPHDLKNPAPLLEITGGGEHGHHDVNMGSMDMPGMNMGAMAMDAPATDAAGATATVGDIVLSNGVMKGMLPGQAVGGAYVTLRNNGAAADRLVSVSSPVADHVEIHEMSMANDVMKMRAVKDGIALPPGETVALEPGGFHLMFVGMKAPVKAGEFVKATFTFEKAGAVEMALPVVDPRSMTGSSKKK